MKLQPVSGCASKYSPVLSESAGRRITPSEQIRAESPPLVVLSTKAPPRPVRRKAYSRCGSPSSSASVTMRIVLIDLGYSARISACWESPSSRRYSPRPTQSLWSACTRAVSPRFTADASNRSTSRPPKPPGAFTNTTGWRRRKAASVPSSVCRRSRYSRPRNGPNVLQNRTLSRKTSASSGRFTRRQRRQLSRMVKKVFRSRWRRIWTKPKMW